jgi:hypothetical protein
MIYALNRIWMPSEKTEVLCEDEEKQTDRRNLKYIRFCGEQYCLLEFNIGFCLFYTASSTSEFRF